MQALISDCKARKVQRVVTYKLDRLSRSQKDTLHLIEDVFLPNGIAYVSMLESLDTGSAFGMAMIGILSVFAQLERETIKERMQLGRVASVRSGNWRGGGSVPFGYRFQAGTGDTPSTIVPDPVEAEAVRRMYELFLEGNSYKGILERIREEFPLPGRGEKTPGSWAQHVLQNRVYIGQQLYAKEWMPSNHEPILDEGIFWAVQAKLVSYQEILDSRLRVPRHRGHLLTGFLWCGCCGSRLHHRTAHYTSRRTGETATYNSYVCETRRLRPKDCPDSGQWEAADLEDMILSQIEALRLDDSAPAASGTANEIRTLERKLAGISRQQEKLVELFTLGGIPAEAIQKQSQSLAEERERLENRIDALRVTDDAEAVRRRQEAVERSINIRGMTETEQRDIMRVLIDRINIHPGRKVEIIWKI